MTLYFNHKLSYIFFCSPGINRFAVFFLIRSIKFTLGMGSVSGRGAIVTLGALITLMFLC